MVSFRGSLNRPELEFSAPTLDLKCRRKLTELVLLLHGIADPSELYIFMGRDKVLRRIKRGLYGFGRAGRMAASLYEGVVKAIIQQQISLRVADHLTANLVEKFGEHLMFLGEKVYDFPRAENLAEAGVEELRGCGLSRRKAEYVKALSREVALGNFNPEELYGLSRGEIVRRLTAFKGLGRWSAELVMAASMGLNVIPADDLGVRRALSHYYFNGKLQDGETIRKFAEEKFGSFMLDVTVYLLMAYRMGI
jgi:DNA-3-methyladenine glycosylase II